MKERAPKKEIFGWAMFDFANSAYTTVIITVVFAAIFPKLIVGVDSNHTDNSFWNAITGLIPSTGSDSEYRFGNALWGLAQAAAYVLVVISAPIFGAIMDYSASKKKFLFASYLLTIIATIALYFVQPGGYILGMILIMVSLFGFATGENFVSSFLPNLGPPEDLGKISGMAWGLGYFGGLLSTIIVVFGLGSRTLENFSAQQWVGPITGIFFMVAAIPTFLWVKERGQEQILPAGETYLKIGFKRLKETYKEIKEFRDLMVFLLSVLFAQGGLAVIISFAFIYGEQVIKWDESTGIIMFIVTQITAAGGAVLFGVIQDKIGAKKTFNITLVMWVVCVTLIWGAKDFTAFLNSIFDSSIHPQTTFLFVGSLAGMGLGSTQSASRAIVGMFSPESKSGEFFGFWGLSTKLASIFGLFGIVVMQSLLGLEQAILICTVFFFLALVVNFAVNYDRGMAKAKAHENE